MNRFFFSVALLAMLVMAVMMSCSKEKDSDAEEAAIEKAMKQYPDSSFSNLGSGVLLYVTNLGDSTEYKSGSDTVRITYTGTSLQQNLVFVKNEKLELPINKLIKGLQIAVYSIPRKTKAVVIVPYNVAYGTSAYGNIAPCSTLKFEIYVE